tara:strand:+ start:32 stop:1228 length:1197 start_codon:yes stop_codon:yes gene_type:complete
MKTIENAEIKNKCIIFRADLNVPVVNGKITDDSRIVSIIPSINKLIDKKNKIFILAHFGRPKGKVNKELSIEFLCEELRKRLKISKVHFLKTLNNEEIKNKQSEMNYGEVCLFENIRFYKEEENNETNFSKKLSVEFEIFVNDAFSASHRNHASIVGLPKYLPSFAGLNFMEEILNLNNFLINSKRPNLAIIGGSKISTKINVIYNLVKLFDSIIIGGAMANTFLLAKYIKIGNSIYEKDFIEVAKEILIEAENNKTKIILPVDAICSNSLNDNKDVLQCNIKNIPNNKMILDVGDETTNIISDEINKSHSVLWNGPLGAFEFKPFEKSSIVIANNIKKKSIKNNLKALAGGGDTLSAINLADAKDGFSYLSNAGGAFLEWLEGNKSPGYIALEKNNL